MPSNEPGFRTCAHNCHDLDDKKSRLKPQVRNIHIFNTFVPYTLNSFHLHLSYIFSLGLLVGLGVIMLSINVTKPRICSLDAQTLNETVLGLLRRKNISNSLLDWYLEEKALYEIKPYKSIRVLGRVCILMNRCHLLRRVNQLIFYGFQSTLVDIFPGWKKSLKVKVLQVK